MNIFEQIPEEASIEFLYDKIDTSALFNDFANEHFNITFDNNVLNIRCKYHNIIEYSKSSFSENARTFKEVSILDVHIRHTSEGMKTHFKLWKFVTNTSAGYLYNVHRLDDHKIYETLQSALYSLILKSTISVLDEGETLSVLHKHFNKFK